MLAPTSNVFGNIVNNISYPVLLLDEDLIIRFANRGALKFFGLDDVITNLYNFANFVHKGSMYIASALCNNGLKGLRGDKVRISFRTLNGKLKHGVVSCCPITDNGKVKYLQIIITDLTDIVSLDSLRKRYFQSLEKEVEVKEQHGKEVLRASVMAIAALAESIDKYTYAHLQRIRHYCKSLATYLKNNSKYKDFMTDVYIELLYELSPLHDLGKVAIRDSVLQKTGKLSEEDFKIMQEHTNIGANALKMAGDLSNRPEAFAIAEMIARFHHEKWDGTGYPAVKINDEFRPLKGEEIPLCARIVAFADVFDALTSERPYKKPYPFEAVKKMVVEQSCKHFDPSVIEAFLSLENEFKEIRRKFPDKEDEKLDIDITQLNEFELSERDREYQELLKQEKVSKAVKDDVT